ncbi:AbrB family transcriptional regulator [Nodosilinea sp. E11]|uniref:AbrB family transcriptional regulator n=1 Tax=Nodosilinea sp. E11 TaxID=3037479 RepID=UPI00293507E0|nr:AbrB family transcriptional regulator [Nodosilinea sp. E11]WOD36952.1 AbrB family transcriptional regulator [Nodosilinea sp. E11]
MAVKEKGVLVGKELLAKVKENDGQSKRELAKECGYYTISKDGQTRVNLSEFYDALLSAKGIQLEPQKGSEGRGREATYTLTVHKNGQIVIGAAYTQEMGLKTGDVFKIKLGYKHIHLVKLDEEGNEDDA